MRRSICSCEPNVVRAGTSTTFKFIYTTSTELPKGTLLKFDLLSYGRPNDWEIPDVQNSHNLIWAELPKSKKLLKAKKFEKNINFSTAFEFVLPTPLHAGDTLIIYLGSQHSEKNGNRAQTYTQRKKSFILYLDPKGIGDYKESETFNIDVKGGPLKNLKIIVPSIVSRNRRFDIVVRFEDLYGNLTNYAPEGTLIDLSYENLRENLNWKLFVPETGFLTLPNLYFNEQGVYRIQLKNLATNELFFSPPIKCFAETDLSLFWGLFHGESPKSDSTENIESALRHFRDEYNLCFYAISPFDSLEETSTDIWKKTSQKILELNEDERFTTFCGSQWLGNPQEEGLRQFIYFKDNKPLLRKKDLKSNSLKKIYKTLVPKELISIPSFTMGKTTFYDFADFNPDFEKIVEIYNAWGSSECSQKEGNPRPIKGKLCPENPEGSIRKALNNNCRFGFVAGGLDDRGIYEKFYDSDQVQYSPGLTAILAKTQTREALFEALTKRACYATTGPRIVLNFEIAGAPFGSILSTNTKPGLIYNRYITGFVVGTGPLQQIEIIRNGKVFHVFEKNGTDFDFIIDDSEPFNNIAFFAKDKSTQFIYYYLRVIQKDGHIAWSSPIWIDHLKNHLKKPLKNKIE